MKILSSLLFLLLISTSSIAGPNPSNQNDVFCISKTNEADQIFKKAISNAKKNPSKGKEITERAKDEAQKILITFSFQCFSNPYFVSRLVIFDSHKMEYDLALEHVNEGLNINPTESSLFVRKAEVLFKLGRTEEAFEMLSLSYQYDKTDQGILYNYCRLLSEYQKHNQAITICTEAISNCEINNNVCKKIMLALLYSNRAYSYSELNKESQAMHDINKAKELGLPNPGKIFKPMQNTQSY